MRVNSIDVLKAFAIIAVVLYHLGYIPYGYLGVDLFLVISGFFTTKSLLHRNLTAWGGYFEFEISRVARLLPPLLIACAVCLAVGYNIMIDATLESLSQSVIATCFMGNNIVELIATGDYWAITKSYSPLMHTWYVGIVMQFYLLYPLLFYIAKFDKYNPQRTLAFLITVFGVISLLLYVGETDNDRRFYLLHTRFYEFAVGGLVALLYKKSEKKNNGNVFAFACYALLLCILFLNFDFLLANVKLLAVIAISAVLLCSHEKFENRITGNIVLAKIGAASYSIFIWHQIVLAFYRCIFGYKISIMALLLLMFITGVLSWLSYQMIEKKTSVALKTPKGRYRYCFAYGTFFVILTVATFGLYMNAGVVRDIPELEVYKSSPERGKWPKYNNRIFSDDKPFTTEKQHWLVVGNSYGRDFANIIYESEVADQIEVSYAYKSDYLEVEDRFKDADIIFIASKGIDEKLIHQIEIIALANGHTLKDVVVVGEKYFGETMSQVYSRRYCDDYFDTELHIPEELIQKNSSLEGTYKERFLNLLSFSSKDGIVCRVFTDDHKFMSCDCTHLTQAGAKFFADLIDWNNYLKIKK